MKLSKEYILAVGLVLFALASAITTFLGVSLVMKSFENWISVSMAVCISIGTSAMMIYLGLKTSEIRGRGNILMIALGYLFIASISVFFNFHTFFGSQAVTSALDSDAKNVRAMISQNFAEIESAMRDQYDIVKLEQIVAIDTANMVSEETHNSRPGKGGKHQVLKEKFLRSKNTLIAAQKRYRSEIANIKLTVDDTKQMITDALASDNTDELKQAIRLGSDTYEALIGKRNSISGSNIEAKLELSSSQLERPDYMVNIITQYFKDKSKLSEQSISRVHLSFGLSVFLDFPIFITLLFVNTGRDSYEDEEEGKEEEPELTVDDFWQ